MAGIRHGGFTLIEMLAVIGIIAILAGMVFGGVTVAKRSALKTKSVSLLQQVSQALNSYRTLNGSYPDSWLNAGGNDLYAQAFKSSSTYKEASAVAASDWLSINQTVVAQLAATGESLPSPVKDAWGSPLRYRPAKYYPFDNAKSLFIDKDDGVPCRDSFQLWSIGADKADQYAADGSDDLPAWK